MTTVEEYLDKLWKLYPPEGETPAETIELADQAVKDHPDSPELQVLRGHLILLGDEDCPYDSNEAVICFQKAVEIDPEYAEAWEEIGHFYEAVEPDQTLSRKAFEKAEELRKK
jgi:tetratricopeptide (TPR) repeat protein